MGIEVTDGDTFTFDELRVVLTAFASWAALVPPNSVDEARKLADRFLVEQVERGL